MACETAKFAIILGELVKLEVPFGCVYCIRYICLLFLQLSQIACYILVFWFVRALIFGIYLSRFISNHDRLDMLYTFC